MKTSRHSAKPPASYTLRALAAAAGLPARTVRYYIACGVLPGPEKAGRGATYTATHLARLRAIQRRQRRGESLAEIRAALAGAAPAPSAALWRHYLVADDITVLLRDSMPPWRTHLVLRHIDALARALHTSQPDCSHNTSHTHKERT